MGKREKSFDVILFDLGGTLIWFNGNWPEVVAEQHLAMVRHLVTLGYQLDETQFAAEFLKRLTAYYQERDTEFIEYTTEYILRSLLVEYGYENAPSAHLRPALDSMYAVTQTHWQAEEDTYATLDELKKRGYRLGLISNANDAEDVQILIDQHHLRPYFEIILISATIGRRKPHPAIFRLAIDHFQVSSHRALMVGDTLGADILGAQNAGIFGVWITRRASKPDNHDHLDTIQPDATISTLDELTDLLDNWPRLNPTRVRSSRRSGERDQS